VAGNDRRVCAAAQSPPGRDDPRPAVLGTGSFGPEFAAILQALRLLWTVTSAQWLRPAHLANPLAAFENPSGFLQPNAPYHARSLWVPWERAPGLSSLEAHVGMPTTPCIEAHFLPGALPCAERPSNKKRRILVSGQVINRHRQNPS